MFEISNTHHVHVGGCLVLFSCTFLAVFQPFCEIDALDTVPVLTAGTVSVYLNPIRYDSEPLHICTLFPSFVHQGDIVKRNTSIQWPAFCAIGRLLEIIDNGRASSGTTFPIFHVFFTFPLNFL